MKKNSLNQFREVVLLVVGIITGFSVLLINITNILAFGILGIVAIASYFIFSFLYWTCPNCKKPLPLRSGKIYVCPYCGYRIEKEKKD